MLAVFPGITLLPTVPNPHWYTAPDKWFPPLAVSVVLLPIHNVVVPEIVVGAVDF